jgi:CheY-like chemotaxis protein
MNQQRVLVLDDHEAILEVVTEALRYEQLDVLGIREGRAFLTAVTDFRPDLILLDYRLADANGGDLCKQVKTLEVHRHIPVIIFSAYFNPGETLPADCDGYLYKPFDLAELFKLVRQFLPVKEVV